MCEIICNILIGQIKQNRRELEKTHSSIQLPQPWSSQPCVYSGWRLGAGRVKQMWWGAWSCHGSTFTEMRRLLAQLTGNTGSPFEGGCLSAYLLISGCKQRGATCGAGSRRVGCSGRAEDLSLPCRRQRMGKWVKPWQLWTNIYASCFFVVFFNFLLNAPALSSLMAAESLITELVRAGWLQPIMVFFLFFFKLVCISGLCSLSVVKGFSVCELSAYQLQQYEAFTFWK